MSLNYIDGVIVLLLLLFALGSARRGVFAVAVDVALLGLSVLLAFRLVSPVGGWIDGRFGIPESYARVLGFLVVLVLVHVVLGIAARRLLRAVPPEWHGAPASRLLAVAPALAYGAVFVGALLLAVHTLPTSPDFKRDMEQSRVGGLLLDRAVAAERAFADVFGDALHDTLSLLVVTRGPTESIPLTVSPAELTVDAAAEAEMLQLVNREREAHGLAPLEFDPTLVPAARAHSRDMWERGYFSHINPDGDDPFDRMRASGIRFRVAGENLALARTTGIAHQGLMDSPGHRRNILDPSFTRIGIGVIDGAPHGKMYTQLFAG